MHPFGDNMVLYAVRKMGVFLDRFEPKNNASGNAYQMDISNSTLHLKISILALIL